MSWMICQQTPYNQIKVLEESGKVSYQGYNEFLTNLLKVPLYKRQDFKINLDKFKIVSITLENGEWEVFDEQTVVEEHSFEDMLALNKPKEEDIVKSKKDILLEKSHKFIDNYRKDWKFYD